MKYKSIKPKENKHKVLNLCGGVNCESDEAMLENQLRKNNNIISADGVLRSRKGVFSDINSLMGNHAQNGHFKKDLCVTDAVYQCDGEEYRLAYDIWNENDLYETLNVYLLNKDNELTQIDSFYSGNLEEFYRFSHAFFIIRRTDTEQKIYIYITKIGTKGDYILEQERYFHSVYVYNRFEGCFESVPPSKYYSPIVYTNGRGNRYDEAKKLGTVYDEPPTVGESVNLLGGCFTALFSSDGLSTRFKLPLSNIDQAAQVECYYYNSAVDNGLWIIEPYASTATCSLDGVTVTIKVQRETGDIVFYNGNTEFALPKAVAPIGNNITFIAAQYLSNEKRHILCSQYATQIDSTVYIYGNQLNKSEIYTCDCNNPLYFPESAMVSIGSFNNPVTAVLPLNKSIIAIKPDGIYKLKHTAQSSEKLYLRPTDVFATYIDRAAAEASQLNLSFGTSLRKTITVCKDKIIFFDGNKIYCVADNGKVGEISVPVNSIIESLENSDRQNAFSVNLNGNYALFIGNTVLYLNCNTENFGVSEKETATVHKTKNIAFDCLTLPEEIKPIDSFNNYGTVLICRFNEKSDYFAYITGEKDVFIDSSGDFATEKEIPYELLTKKYDFESDGLKNILSLNLKISGNGITDISVSGDKYFVKQAVKFKNTALNDVKILPHILPVKEFSFSVSGNGPLRLNKADIEYQNL